MTQITINSEASLQHAIGDLREAYREHKFLRLSWSTGKARSMDQNAISHAWYSQIARELREDTALGVKNFCKLHYGVPILRAENAEFREQYDFVLKPLSYERKLAAMNFLPVTSLMNKDEMSQYLMAIQLAFADRVRLEFTADDRIAA
jgi:hypothetical protein